MLAMAACVVAMVTFVPRPVLQKPATRTKGGAGIIVRVAGVDGQRNARVDSTEALARGERLRIGYQSGPHRYLIALTIDEHGVVRPCRPSRARAWRCPTARRARPATCPTAGSWTGRASNASSSCCRDQPIDVETAIRAARAAYDKAGGNLARMPSLDLPGEQFVRTFAKP